MNWKNIIQELIDSGMTQQQIAEHAGVTQPTLYSLFRGKSKSTSYEVGDRLIALWKVKANKVA